ncbi:MAG: site-specific DNA-methyltransferase [Chloroflexota bacterium]|nr:site-specific DNA-methyltransferase [Chloroflexota bacterium]
MITTSDTALDANAITPTVKNVLLSAIKFDESLYPRRDGHKPNLVQKYAETLDQIEAHKKYIAVAADGTLLDGRHRHLAYRTVANGEDREIPAFSYDVHDRGDMFDIAAQLNSTHGDQLSKQDKIDAAQKMYRQFGRTQDEIAQVLSASKTLVNDALRSILADERKARKKNVIDLWMRCETTAYIAEDENIDTKTVRNIIEEWGEKYRNTKFPMFEDDGWKAPLYNIWNFHKLTNDSEHFGNSAQEIVDNLLYMYTEPFDIVLDPFAGGGSTIDVCKKRSRRYWVSDRKPIEARAGDIRQSDISEGPPPLHKRWSDVSLVYLDPPYWRQAQNQYSQDPSDLANMDLEQFYGTLVVYVKSLVSKLRKGAHIALLIQPTQWSADDRQVVDHVFDLVQRMTGSTVQYKHRIICPYSTEQYNAQQVTWAKDQREVLVLNRELIVWEVE